MKIQKMLMHLIRNRRGFSLAEVMIAAGMMGIVSLGVMNLMQETSKSSKHMATNFETNQISQSIEGLLKHDVACRLTLQGLNPAGGGAALNFVRDRNNLIGFRGDCVLAGPRDNCLYGGREGRVFIRSMRIHQFQNAAQPFNNSANQATVSVTFQKGPAIGTDWPTLTQAQQNALKALSPGEGEFTKNFRVNVRSSTGAAPDLQPINTIEDCVTERDDYLTVACAMLGGNRADPTVAPNNATDTAIIQNVTIGGVVVPHCKQVVFSTWGITPTALESQGWAGTGNVMTADGRAQVTGLLQVEGNVQADTTLTVGGVAVPIPAAGGARILNDLRVDRSVGVGVAPPTTAGDVRVAGGVGVGVVPPGAGQVSTSGNVAVGVPLSGVGNLTVAGTTVVAGNTTLNTSLGVGIAAPGTVGNARINRALSVGVLVPPGGSGDIQNTGSLGVGAANVPETTNGRVKATRIRIMNGGMMTINDDGVWPGAGERLYVNGNIKIVQSNTDTVTDHAASIGWVASKIGQTLGPNAAQAMTITNDIIAAAPSQVGLAVIKANMCITMRVRNTSGSYAWGIWNAGADTCTLDVIHTVDTNTVYNITCPAGQFIYRLTAGGNAYCADPNKLYPYNATARTESQCYSWGGSVVMLFGEKVCQKNVGSCGSPVVTGWAHQTNTYNHSHSPTYDAKWCGFGPYTLCSIGHAGWQNHTSQHSCSSTHTQEHWDSGDGFWEAGDCRGTSHASTGSFHGHSTVSLWVACY